MEGGQRLLRPGNERDTMKLSIDKEADALYLRLDESPIIESEEVAPGIVLDYNEAEQVVGIEMMNLSKRSPKTSLTNLQLQI